MYTVKHIERDGFESIVQAQEVWFHPGRAGGPEDPGHPREFTASGVPGADAGARIAGVVRYGSGRIYVMNEAGKTVANYDM